MRRKALLTAGLCLVLAVASSCASRGNFNIIYAAASSAEKDEGDAGQTISAPEGQMPEETVPRESQPEPSPISEPSPAPSEAENSGDGSQAPPATEPPTQAPPATEPPATEPPTQAPPATEPSTQAPPATEPSTQAPPATEPSTQAPPATEPSTQAPPATEPSTQAPPATEPSTQAPPATEPSTQAPPATEPSTQAPPATEPSTQAPPATEPSTQAPPATEPPTGESQTTPPAEPSTGELQTPPATEPPLTEQQTLPPAAEPAQTETAAPGQTEPGTSGETMPAETETAEPAETETGAETETETGTETETESESESESEKEKISNEELIARQKIIVPPKIEKEFRFTQVEKQYAIVKNPDGTSVREKKSSDAREVGVLPYYGSCFILEDREDGWYYVESGNVRGFVEAAEVVTGDAADRIVKIKGLEELPQARLLIARTDNAAYTYTHTTVQDVMAVKEYALASGEVKIYEQKNDASRATGRLADQALCYILADSDDEWIFVESGNARGFVRSSQLVIGKAASQKVAETGEPNFSLAETLVKPEENKACYYTLTSVKEASQGAKTREAMISFAKQFLGNPYVWGGTSLTAGADCSGFVQSIYSYFGYSLPRVAEDQAVYGMQIPISSAEPGDLIFYARNGYVYHVSMYIGDGQVIQAAGRKTGIIISGIGGNAVWATRIIQD